MTCFGGGPNDAGSLSEDSGVDMCSDFSLLESLPFPIHPACMEISVRHSRSDGGLTDHLVDSFEIASPAFFSTIAGFGVPALLHDSFEIAHFDESVWYSP